MRKVNIICSICRTEIKLNPADSVVDAVKKINWGIRTFEHKRIKIREFLCEECSEELEQKYAVEVI